MTFSGFQMDILNIPGSAAVSSASLMVGAYSTALTLPTSPTSFSATAPITFNTLTSFSFSFNATAAGTFFHDGTYALDGADGKVFFPTFTVLNASGSPIAGTVTFTPEPVTWYFGALGLLALPLVRRAMPNRT
jgi:hypothetical protein